MAAGRWLLSAARSIPKASKDWEEHGSAWLRPGALFGAVIIPAGLIHAALGLDDPAACAPPLAEVLGGPMFYSYDDFARQGSYTALVPVSAGQDWGMPGTVAHSHRGLLLVPAPGVIEPQERDPWWVVPLDGPDRLCSPDRLAALIRLGRDAIRTAGDGDA
ncbi:hypothetical protein [Streptomyces inusitatus]|nr:hypothetical protein [Streptomyces inusitatus]